MGQILRRFLRRADDFQRLGTLERFRDLHVESHDGRGLIARLFCRHLLDAGPDPGLVRVRSDAAQGVLKISEVPAKGRWKLSFSEVCEMRAVGLSEPDFDRPVTYEGSHGVGETLSEWGHDG
jgi:hypothetical protein